MKIPPEITELIRTELKKELIAIKMHFIKHLNRYHKWHGHIPIYKIDEWDNGNVMYVYESNKNGFSEKILEQMGFNVYEVVKNLGWHKYTLAFIVYDKNTGRILSNGLSDSRDEVLEMYFNKLHDAIKLKLLMDGEH